MDANVANVYRKMQIEKRTKILRSQSLTEEVAIKTDQVSNVINDFHTNMKTKLSDMKKAGATETEVFNVVMSSLKAIGLSKREAGTLARVLVK